MNRHIPFTRLHNFRDLGGWRADDGRTVAWGRLYRSDSLSKLDAGDLARFGALGIRTVVDLRYPWEIADRGRAPESLGVAWHNLSIEHRPYVQAEIDPDVDPWRYLADRYAEVAADGTAELSRALEVIAEGDHPLVFHCASGKDRTGLLAALLLALLGVDEDQIAEDFALTELATDRLVAEWRERNPGGALRWPAYGRAPAEIIRLFLADLTAGHGSVRGYAADRLGVDDDLVAALRARLLTGDGKPRDGRAALWQAR
ncbi:tyrosine-protein phosphatase [Micromonospora soli]|uniref:tyrosine-protein phosphatase n=1 Tax=Micromonospora sp. NBRC 110009 TaxID=3061627 RepID=UPI002671DAF5|nr:tyrosine-protein phosphatase [Micromonospora sp. NBRC 110009]WKT97843.1 tyrosine-protein phosphatase [Micromonospora sp. NBRC 110009]